MGRSGYWGVGVGAGVIVGGGVVWGMSSTDCHNADAEDLKGNAGNSTSLSLPLTRADETLSHDRRLRFRCGS